MYDLIEYFNIYNNINQCIAKKHFKDSIHYSGNDKIIIVGEHQYAAAYIYENNQSHKYLNYKCEFCNLKTFRPKLDNKCITCARYIMTNNIGVPMGTESIADFYIYNDKLFIIQEYENEHKINKLYKSCISDNWMPLKWRRTYYMIITIFGFKIPLDLKRSIMKNIIF